MDEDAPIAAITPSQPGRAGLGRSLRSRLRVAYCSATLVKLPTLLVSVIALLP